MRKDAGGPELRTCTTECEGGTRAACRSTEGWRAGGDVPIRAGQKGGTQSWLADLGAGGADLPAPDDIAKSFSGQTSQQYQERMKIQAVEGSRMASN